MKRKERVSRGRLSSYREKTLHGQYVRGTEDVRDPRAWDWLKRGTLKKETEDLLAAAQDQALRTNYIRNMIDKQDVSPMCRLCGEREETVSHIVTECKKLAQKQYTNWRRDQVTKVVHWKLCQNYDLQCNGTWYDHSPAAVMENDQVKLLWDFRIQTDHPLDHSRPNIVVLAKGEQSVPNHRCGMSFSYPNCTKEQEKIDHYQDIKVEIQKM